MTTTITTERKTGRTTIALSKSLLAALSLLLGIVALSFGSVASAESPVDDDAISSFGVEPGGPGPTDPEPDPEPAFPSVVDDLAVCEKDIDTGVCDTPDPGPTPTTPSASDDLAVCEKDIDTGVCDDGEPDPVDPTGPGDLTTCDPDDDCDPEPEGPETGGGDIDQPIPGNPDFTG